MCNLQLLLAHNQIEAIPTFITSLQRLTMLDVSHNALQTLPRTLGKCANLGTLMVEGNKITSPPPVILGMGTASVILYLQQLCDAETNARITLSQLNLTVIPMEIAELRRVTTVDMSKNQLTTIRPLNALTRLTSLNMSSNRLTDVDDDLRDCEGTPNLFCVILAAVLFCFIPYRNCQFTLALWFFHTHTHTHTHSLNLSCAHKP